MNIAAYASQRLFGAVIHDIPWDENRNLHLKQIERDLQTLGRRPYFVPTARRTLLAH